MPTDWKGYIPYGIAAGLAGVLCLFGMFRADNLRAGEAFPTKLAVAQTYSAIAGFFRLKRRVRATDLPPEPPREFFTEAEMKATITPGRVRAVSPAEVAEIRAELASRRARKPDVVE